MHTPAHAPRTAIIKPVAAVLLTALLCLPAVASAAPAPTPMAATTPVPPCAAAGSTAPVKTAIIFGRQGGNIRPMQVIISTSGAVNYQGAAPASPTYAITPAAVVGLLRLAGVEGFWNMPAILRNPDVLPDIASLFIRLRSGCSDSYKTVQARGGGFPAFGELYDTLTAAAGLGTQGPLATQVPGTQGSPRTITLANNGRSLRYVVGQLVLLQLGPEYRWTVTFANPTLFQRQLNMMMIPGAQGIYMAAAPGQTTLSASGLPACTAGRACSNLALRFQVSLTVTGS
jgi:hypothetical protein